MMIILKWMIKIELKSVDYIYLAQNRNKWQVIMIIAINFPFP